MLSNPIRRAIQFIDERFCDSTLSLKVVASASGLSVPDLCRELKRVDGRGFRSRLHIARTQEASRLLSESQLSIKQIAAAVGYGHSSHLCRHFRKQFGTTPSNFRRLATLQQ